MDPIQQDPRALTDEEAALWMQELVVKLTDEKGSAGSACSLEAIKNPVRRAILMALDDRALDADEVARRVGVEGATLRYHLNFLATSYFVSIEGERIDLTPGGVAFVRGNRRTSPGNIQS